MEMTENLNEKEPKIYEIGYLLSPLVAEASLVETVNSDIRKPIEDAKAKVVSEIAPEMKVLAYEVRKDVANKTSKFTDAYFGSIRFEARPSMIAAINEALDSSDLVLRYMTIIAPKDNPPRAPRRQPAAPKAKTETETPASPAVEEGEKAPVKNEEIDKEIDGILAKV